MSWYYTLNEQQAGPISKEELLQKLGNELPADNLVWTTGMAEWTKANEVPELQAGSAGSPLESASPAAAGMSAVNPYSAPQTHVSPQASAQDYPLPKVKRANYPLYLTLTILGFALLFGGLISMGINVYSEASAIESNPSYYEDAEFGVDDDGNITAGGELYNPQTPDFSDIFSPGAIAALIIGAIIMLSAFIIGLIYTHRAWQLLQPAGARTTPGKAVGFQFIPLFNLYWYFIAYWKWAQDWNTLCTRHNSLQQAPRGSEGIFLGAAICQCVGIVISYAGLGQIVCQMIGMKSLCNAINFAAENGE